MSFPVVYDIAIAAYWWVMETSPKVVDHAAILRETTHKNHYRNVVQPKSNNSMGGYGGQPQGFDIGSASSWLYWNTGQLLATFAVAGFYIYILIAIIIAAVDDADGKYVTTTSQLGQNYNIYVFFTLNSAYLVIAVLKSLFIRYVLEYFNPLDDSQIYTIDEIGFYVWDPEMRLQLDIEGWIEIAKVICIILNYFIYW